MFVVGMSVLFLSIMGTSVQHVSSLMFSIIFLLSLSAVKDWAALYSSLSKLEKSFLIAFVFYMFAAVLSQARGVWLVFPLYVAVGFYYLIKSNKFNYKILTAFLVFVFLIYAFTPAGDLIKKRSEDAVSEVSRFYAEDQYASSVGARLAMWEIAFDVWKRYPIVGAGPGDFDDEILALQKNGKYIGMEVHNSVHNIYMQALVGTGLIGFIALVLVVLVMPLRIFFYKNGHGDEGRLTGFITVTSFVVFGLSESWTLRLSAISVFLVYVVVIAAHIHVVRLQDKC